MYLRTLVPKYRRPAWALLPSSTQLMCVYFLLQLFFMSIFVHALTTDIIINPQFCKVQWVQEGERAGEGPPIDRQTCLSFSSGHARNVPR